MYTGEADWTLIGEVKNNPRLHIPIIGNGDVTSAIRAKECFDKYGVDAIMFEVFEQHGIKTEIFLRGHHRLAFRKINDAHRWMKRGASHHFIVLTHMYYVDFYSLFNNPEKDWATYLKEASDSPPEPSLFD